MDAGRIGVLGRSLGGHYAPKAASGDERFAAAGGAAIAPYVDARTGMVRVENELRWVTGEVR